MTSWFQLSTASLRRMTSWAVGDGTTATPCTGGDEAPPPSLVWESDESECGSGTFLVSHDRFAQAKRPRDTPSSCPAWSMLNQSRNPAKGPISPEFGFMGDPHALEHARTRVPDPIYSLVKDVPMLHANQQLRDHLRDTLHDGYFACCIEDEGLVGWDLLVSKSMVFTLAQAYVDCGRADRGPGEPIEMAPPFPEPLSLAIKALSERLETVPFCVLSDICLYNVSFNKGAIDRLESNLIKPTDLAFHDMSLNAPVLNGLREGETEEARATRERVESRFALTTVEMGYATCDMPYLVAKAQQAMHCAIQNQGYRTALSSTEELIECLGLMQKSATRMKTAFEKLKMRDAPAKVWHRDFAKLTLGYNGNGGPSGPQHPTVHLLDVFLGRQQYKSELGEIILNTREFLPANHREFLAAVRNGPTINNFLNSVSGVLPKKYLERVSDATQGLVDAYITSGFLKAHRKKAYAFLRTGFAGQVPRMLTAGSTYELDEDVPRQMLKSFDSSISERLADANRACEHSRESRRVAEISPQSTKTPFERVSHVPSSRAA